MEVKKPVQSINSYWLKTVDRLNLIATITGLLETALVGLIIFIFFNSSYQPILFWGGLLILASILIIVNAIIVHYVARPLRDLLAATSKSNRDTNTSLIPPNINSNKYKDTGFATAVTAIYNKTVPSKSEQPTSNSSSIDSNRVIVEGLNRLDCNIIILDEKNQIKYYNQGSPVETKPGGELGMSLLFNGKDTFKSWLNHTKDHAVNSERIWRRIPDQVSGQEDRRFFDVYANYKKGSPNETVITMVDRTKAYASDEEALDFIAFAAHELRGPITVIRGYIDVLYDELEDTLVDDQSELFKRLEVSANKLSGYINNILNTSRYDRRHLKVVLLKDTYYNIYHSIADDMQLRATSQGRLLEVMLSQDLPPVAADGNSISEVMGNLIDNAIKYSNEGGLINVTARQNGDFVEFSVTDRGIGMPSNVMANLFQKFYRSHRSRETVAGTGIGLYISKAIVESHGGSISAKSEEGRGSTFTFSLPTYDSISAKLTKSKGNQGIIKEGGGWIKNHGMYRG